LIVTGISFLLPFNTWASPSAQAIYSESFSGGLWKYDYILYNTSDPIADAEYNLSDFALYIDGSVMLSTIVSPNDWDFNSDLSSFISWMSLSLGADIAPGTSLSGFSFESDTQLFSSLFDVYLTDPKDLGNPFLYNSSTLITPPIPEPATLLLIGSGLAGLGYLRGRRFF